MSSKYAAYGTQLKRGNGANPEVFATIAGVRNIGGPSMSTETIDVTAHDSPNATREFLASLKDGGEISLDILFDPADTTQVALTTDWANRTLRNFQIVFPDTANTTWRCTALVTAIGPSAPVEDALTASITLKVSGTPTFS